VPVPLGVPVADNRNQLQVRIGADTLNVLRVKLSVDVSFEIATFDTSEGEHHVYEGEAGTIAQHSRFTGKVFGLPVTFDHQSGPTIPVSATVEFPSGLKLDSSWFGVDPSVMRVISKIPTGSTETRSCALCQRVTALEEHPVLPTFLFPEHSSNLTERLLCASCSNTLRQRDELGNELISGIPHDLGGPEGGCLRIANPPYAELKLWLLSVVWRMSVAHGPIWRAVEPRDITGDIRALLINNDPGGASQFPVGWILPSFDGKHLHFGFEPDCVRQTQGTLIRAAFAGVLFFFCFDADISAEPTDQFYLRPSKDWLVPIVDWKTIDFLRTWVESLYRDNVPSKR
jgi:hypothetical protein